MCSALNFLVRSSCLDLPSTGCTSSQSSMHTPGTLQPVGHLLSQLSYLIAEVLKCVLEYPIHFFKMVHTTRPITEMRILSMSEKVKHLIVKLIF